MDIDSKIEEREVGALQQWVANNEAYRRINPFNELIPAIERALEDGILDPNEIEFLKTFFHEFAERNLKDPMARFSLDKTQMSILGICAQSPKIAFSGKTFSLVGDPNKLRENENFVSTTLLHGGQYTEDVDPHLDYLVVAKQVNPSWAFACYGRKISQVIELRENGSKMLIVKESDFWAACPG